MSMYLLNFLYFFVFPDFVQPCLLLVIKGKKYLSKLCINTFGHLVLICKVVIRTPTSDMLKCIAFELKLEQNTNKNLAARFFNV